MLTIVIKSAGLDIIHFRIHFSLIMERIFSLLTQSFAILNLSKKSIVFCMLFLKKTVGYKILML